jgi:hypothetical protein
LPGKRLCSHFAIWEDLASIYGQKNEVVITSVKKISFYMAFFGPKNSVIGPKTGPIFSSFRLISECYHGPTPGFKKSVDSLILGRL